MISNIIQLEIVNIQAILMSNYLKIMAVVYKGFSVSLFVLPQCN